MISQKMSRQRIKYLTEKDMNVLRRERMKEESKKLLSPKGAIVCREHISSQKFSQRPVR